ncbi:apolipoprotein N-acyltransferase [Thorsellia kenyensis]|uniref:Apolipoprotein N-acyltransferase n=1 Tax=Thorsellia kenyensis TaxID=1549888 RepID=A0ABV6CHC8_9GAMM
MKLTYSNLYKYIASIAFGAVGVLAFSPFDKYWSFNGMLIFVSFTGLLLLLNKSCYKVSKWIGFYWGIGFFGFGIHWVYVSVAGFGGMPFLANIAIVGLLIAYLSIYPALFAYLLNRLFKKNSSCKWIFFSPVFWFLTEFLRSWILTGFPWLRLGYSQINTPLIHYAPILGVEGIDFLIVIICGLVLVGVNRFQSNRTKIQNNLQIVTILLQNPLFFVVLLSVMIPLILKKIEWFSTEGEKQLKVTLVQPNIDQQLRWNSEQLNEILDKTAELTAPYIGKSDLIIWPETAIPSIERYLEDFMYQFDRLLNDKGSQLITGIVDIRNDGQSYNAAIVLGNKKPYVLPDQNTPAIGQSDRYYKHHLVPFGETVPFQALMKQIAPLFDLPMSSFSQGEYVSNNLVAAQKNLLMAICYEIILGQQLRANFTAETDFIVTISNDAWFGRSIGPWQHLQMAQMRAVELGRPVIRATNNGVTAFISADGRILSQLSQFEDGTLTEKIMPTHGVTFFALYGHFINWFIVLFMLLVGLLVNRTKKNR